MTPTEYLKATRRTAIYPKDQPITYCVLGLSGEAGEVLEEAIKLTISTSKVVETTKKAIRASKVMDRSRMRDELGDVAYYWFRLCDELGFSPEEVWEGNVAKLKERQIRGRLKEHD